MNTLSKWIDSVGRTEVAKLLRVSRGTVFNWWKGHCLPTSEKMAKIEKFSKGTVTPAKMHADHWKTSNAKNRWQSKH